MIRLSSLGLLCFVMLPVGCVAPVDGDDRVGATGAELDPLGCGPNGELVSMARSACTLTVQGSTVDETAITATGAAADPCLGVPTEYADSIVVATLAANGPGHALTTCTASVGRLLAMPGVGDMWRP